MVPRGARLLGVDDGQAGGALRVGVLLAALALAPAGCKPSIGSGCTLSTDCSTQGNRVCDTAQPGGYCTQLNCIDNSCADHAVCVLFQVSVPGCAYSDYSAPARTAMAMCMAHCSGDSDCRQSDGYVCADPRGSPWYAAIIDDNQGQRVCIAVSSSASSAAPSSAGVCAVGLPPLDAGPAGGGGNAAPAGVDGGGDGSAAAGLDAGPDADAGDAEIDAGVDAGDAEIDAGVDAGADADGGPGPSDGAGDASGDAAD